VNHRFHVTCFLAPDGINEQVAVPNPAMVNRAPNSIAMGVITTAQLASHTVTLPLRLHANHDAVVMMRWQSGDGSKASSSKNAFQLLERVLSSFGVDEHVHAEASSGEWPILSILLGATTLVTTVVTFKPVKLTVSSISCSKMRPPEGKALKLRAARFVHCASFQSCHTLEKKCASYLFSQRHVIPTPCETHQPATSI
jgi:hypothetical protein